MALTSWLLGRRSVLQPPLFQPLIGIIVGWFLVSGVVQVRKPGRTIRDHRFGTTLDFEFLGVRKVGTNSAVGALQSSLIWQETDWLTYVGSEPCIAWKIIDSDFATF